MLEKGFWTDDQIDALFDELTARLGTPRCGQMWHVQAYAAYQAAPKWLKYEVTLACVERTGKDAHKVNQFINGRLREMRLYDFPDNFYNNLKNEVKEMRQDGVPQEHAFAYAIRRLEEVGVIGELPKSIKRLYGPDPNQAGKKAEKEGKQKDNADEDQE